MEDLPKSRSTLRAKPSGIDTCWHVPVLGALAIFVIWIGEANSGFFYVALKDEFDTKREGASWPTTVMSIMVHLSGVLLWILERWFSIYQIAQIGTILAWLGMIASTFAPSFPWVVVTFGLIYGTGAGISSMALSVLIMTLFDQYRGVASGIKYAGVSLSSLIFAQILVLMQKAYGLRGTFLLCGGIMIHSTALVIPLKEPLWKKPGQTLPELQKPHESAAIDTIGQHQSHSLQSQSPSERTTLLQHESAWKFLRFFQKPIFYVVLLYSLLGDYSSLTFDTTIVDYAMDKGCSITMAESLVMYYSTTALLGRLVIPLIADRKFLRRSTLVTINCFVLAFALLILPHVRSFLGLFVTTLFTAMFLAINASMKNVLMADYLGVDGISTCWAILGPAAVPVWLCNPAIIGIFRDSMGTYDNIYRLHAGFTLLSGIMFYFVSYYERNGFMLQKE